MDIGIRQWSVHAPIFCRLNITDPKPKKDKHWVFNKSILLKENYVQEIKQHINNYFKENLIADTPLPTVWDAMKAVVRGILISIGSKEIREKQSCINSLSEKIKHLEILHKKTCSKQIYRKLLAKRKALEAIDIRSIQRDLLFVKHKFWKKSPQNLKILAWRVKRKRALRQIFALRNSSG